MKRDVENKLILKQWVRVFLIIVFAAFMLISGFSVYKALNPVQAARKELYSYTYKAGLDYRVYLKPNDFFQAPYMEMNKQYIASIIDYIEVDAKYAFQSTEDLDYKYNYEIVATARGMYEDTDGKKMDVWTKTYPISPSEAKDGSGKAFNISKTIKLDYNAYNQIMSDFRSQFGLSVDSRVDLSLKVNVTAGLKGSGENTLNDSQKMDLLIPLLVQTVKIKPDFINTGGNTVYSNKVPNAEINIPLLAISGLLFLGTLVIFVKLVKSLLVVTRKSEYVLAVNKILKEYADVIAETHNMPDLAKYDIVNIKNFNDMVDIEEELHSPIIYFEIEENAKCVFLILTEKTAYRFLLRETDFSHFGNSDTEFLKI